MARHDARNMRPLSQHLLGGFGNVGEGMSVTRQTLGEAPRARRAMTDNGFHVI